MAELVTVATERGVATVTLDRPEARNALSSELLAQLRDVLLGVHGNPDVRALILTGADPVFSAGLDLRELRSRGDNLLDRGAMDALEAFDRPVIGAINGAAVTGGLELALACDVLIASDRARFADTHARVGLVPGWGLSARLPRLVGVGWAKRMSFTGEFVDAKTAQRIGLVTEVVPHDALLDRARELADEIVKGDPSAMRELAGLYDRDLGEALKAETAAFERWNAGLDYASLRDPRA
jgi:enoyl-CoA hydratase